MFVKLEVGIVYGVPYAADFQEALCWAVGIHCTKTRLLSVPFTQITYISSVVAGVGDASLDRNSVNARYTDPHALEILEALQ